MCIHVQIHVIHAGGNIILVLSHRFPIQNVIFAFSATGLGNIFQCKISGALYTRVPYFDRHDTVLVDKVLVDKMR